MGETPLLGPFYHVFWSYFVLLLGKKNVPNRTPGNGLKPGDIITFDSTSQVVFVPGPDAKTQYAAVKLEPDYNIDILIEDRHSEDFSIKKHLVLPENARWDIVRADWGFLGTR